MHACEAHSAASAGPSAAALRALAREAGFSDAGLVALPYAQQERDADRFDAWIRAGRAGTMAYLERRAEAGELTRARVTTPFPWARSAAVCFASYDSAAPRSIAPADPGAGWIARYAWSSRRDEKGGRRPSDYHKVLLKRLKALEARLHAEFGEFDARGYVDTGPVVERALATAAGLGWTAKNTCLIHPRLGSFGFLAVLLTALPVQKEEASLAGERVPDRCGSCRRCIDACPTGALVAPYQMDAARCISYLTIEHKGPIAEQWRAAIGRQVFGCDICQDVCPWNARALRAGLPPLDEELAPRAELINPALEGLAAMDEAAFEAHFNGSPVRRAGLNGLRRNLAIAMGNSGLARFAARLEEWAGDADQGLRSAAAWALKRIQG
ncbi:MAG: tRNA epoxyqueuosine(34) reductase QueG [Acidobacteriota bacterium]